MKKTKIEMRKGTKLHSIYEAMATHPKELFTAFEIFKEVKKAFPETKITHVQTVLSKWAQAGFIEKTDKKRKSKGHDRKTTLWMRKEKAPQPVVIDKAKKPAVKKKEIPAEIDALTLGESIIDYVSYLQGRLSDLGLNLRETKERADTQEKALKREVGQKQYEIDGLQKANQDLRNQVAQKRRTFKMDPVINFKKQKGAGA